MQKILMGNDAIAWGLINSGVEFTSGYPGTPSSEILASFQKIRDSLGLQAYAEWATNEKVGFEVAYAASMSGRRACATMKQVGLNVASDALMSALTSAIKAVFCLYAPMTRGFTPLKPSKILEALPNSLASRCLIQALRKRPTQWSKRDLS